MEREPKFKFDIQGLVRTGIMIATMVGGCYHMINIMSERAAANEGKIVALEQKVDTHIKNIKIYTWEELTKSFVTRDEWDSNNKYLREDVKYIRDKMDLIFNKLVENNKITLK